MNCLSKAAGSIPRLLSSLDRNPSSATYGCFDRNYWHYKITTDYPSAIFQQGVLSMSLVYKNGFDGNIYYRDPNILEWIKAGLLFWSGIQNRDGTFNEWFPQEHSHVATAFTSYAVSEAMMVLGEDLDPGLREKLAANLRLAGGWLGLNKDSLAANHAAGATAALYNIYTITRDDYFRKAAEDNLSSIAGDQNEEGWFPEYGGADIGYLSLSIDYLARYFEKSGDGHAGEMLKKALSFLSYFIHPDGTAGGSYGSRNTEYIMPCGLVMLAPHFAEARMMLKKIWPTAGEQIDMFDDRYFIFFMLPNFIEACLRIKEEFISDRGGETGDHHKVFDNSGLLSVKKRNYHIFCNFKKSGVFRVYSGQKLIMSDAGYFGVDDRKRRFSSQWFDKKSDNGICSEDRCMKIRIKTDFFIVPVPGGIDTVKLISLRLFNLSLGRIGICARLFNDFIKNKKIASAKKYPMVLERVIEIMDDKISIDDTIRLTGRKTGLDWFGLCPEGSSRHVPSANYFRKEILRAGGPAPDLSGALNSGGKLTLSRKIDFSGTDSSPKITAERK